MKIKFNDIAINSVAKKKPVPEDAEHYIGLEHIDSGSFKISRWGSAVAPIGDKLLMKKGDVLFGKRRAYQRKVAIAPFDGIFSAHGMVLRPKTDVVDERYFPFFIASDQFMDEAVRISVGGLSPTINWKTLKECEFDLPPIEEQRALAEKLWAANDLKEKYQKLLVATDEMLKAKFREMFGECGGQSAEGGVREIGLLEIGECKNGLNFSPNETGAMIKCVGVSDFGSKTSLIDFSEVADLSVNNLPSQEYWLQDNDFLFVRSNGNKDLVGRCMLIKPGDVRSTFGGFCIRYRLHDKAVLHKWILYWFRSEEIRRRLQGRSGNGSINNLSQSILAEINVPIPPIELQRKFVAIANAAEASKAELKKSIASIDAVMKGLING